LNVQGLLLYSFNVAYPLFYLYLGNKIKKMRKLLSLAVLFFAFASMTFAQDITGTWKTTDDETGEDKSYVTIYEKNGEYFGKVTTILNPAKKDAKCNKCKGAKKGQPVQDMIIIRNLKKGETDGVYVGGKILDPNKGKEYKMKATVDGDNLKVRGFIGFESLGRTQHWVKVK